jgi:hypothetical protein
MSNGWTGKDAKLGMTLAASATDWATTQVPAASDGIKQKTMNIPFGEPSITIQETTDDGWKSYVDMGNVAAIDFPVEPDGYRFCSASTSNPIDEALMSLCYSATSAVLTGSTAAYLHTALIAGDGLAMNVSRWFSISGAIKNDAGTYSTQTIQSWQPTGFTWSSEAGNDPCKLTIKGSGNRVLLDDTGVIAGFANLTYTDVTRIAHHYHLCSNNDATAGVWMKEANADGGSKGTLTVSDAVYPSKISFEIDRKMESQFTVCQWGEQARDNGFTSCVVKMSFPYVTDALQAMFEPNLKGWEDGTTANQKYFHLRARWVFPEVIDTTFHPYIEFGFSKLRITKIDKKVDAGKVIGYDLEFEALRPTAIAHLPDCFINAGSATAGTFRDTFYVAIQSKTTTALIA